MSGKVSASKDGEGIIFQSGRWASVAAIPIMTLIIRSVYAYSRDLHL